MTIVLFLVIITLLFASLYYYKYHMKPKRLIEWYKETLQMMGYNVISFPYHAHKIMLLENQRHNQKQYGDCFHDQKHNWKNIDVVISNTSYMVTLIFVNPTLIKHFFTPQKNYIMQKSHLNKYGFKMALGESMIMNEGEVWKNKRKLLSQIFNFDFIKRNVPKMKEICKEMLDKMEKNSNIKKTNQDFYYQIELKKLFGDIISNIIIRCFFGAEGTTATIDGISINKYLSNILKDGRDQSTDVLVLLLGERSYKWSLKPKYHELNSKLFKLRQEVKSIINKRKERLLAQKNPNIDKYTDIFQAMWILKTNGQKQLSTLDQDEMAQQFCAFMAAGNDSTSFFTNMIFYYLCQNPQVETKLREEIEKHITTETQINFKNLKEIKYLEWVQLETTRMYGPATSIFLREAVQDTYVDNIPIFKGVGVKMELLPNHYSEKYFKNALKFDPMRWSNPQQIHPYAYGGFSFGARTCLGKHLAYLATKVIVVMLLKRYRKIQILKDSQIRFEFKGFYTPSPFQSLLIKPLKTENIATQEQK